MISQVEIENFQSITQAKLDLGQLTVFVGPSSSGKSAVLRALRVLSRNTSSTTMVSHGQKTFQVKAHLPEAEVAIERGKASSTYALTSDGVLDTYAKAGVSVPEDIAKVLKMPLVEGLDLNHVNQFQPPFLLGESASTAAKALGGLTNASLLAEAAKEANRRRLETSRTLGLRKQDLVAVTAQLEQFRELPNRIKQFEQLKADHAELKLKAEKLKLLRDIESEAETLLVAIEHARSALTAPNPYESLADLDVAATRARELRAVLKEVGVIAHGMKDAKLDIEGSRTAVDKYETEHHDLLVQVGKCPTCGQEVQ